MSRRNYIADRDGEEAARDEHIARLEKAYGEEVCVCGDYRRQHENGAGRCSLNGLGHGVPGYSCEKFERGQDLPAPAPTPGRME